MYLRDVGEVLNQTHPFIPPAPVLRIYIPVKPFLI